LRWTDFANRKGATNLAAPFYSNFGDALLYRLDVGTAAFVLQRVETRNYFTNFIDFSLYTLFTFFAIAKKLLSLQR